MPHAAPLKLCAAIVHYGPSAQTEATVSSLHRLSPSPNHIVVIDNSPATEPFAGDQGVSVISSGENSGYAGAVNQALDFARDNGYSHCWILNNDVTVSPDSITYITNAISANPDSDIIGSYVRNGNLTWFGGGRFDDTNGRATHMLFRVPIDAVETGEPVATDWINGCSMVIPTKAYLERGSFDEHLFLYKEELEWQLREPRASATLIREFLVDHRVGQTTGSTNGHLGFLFMSRNGYILAMRQSGLKRLRWLGAWAFEFLVIPLFRLRVQQLKTSLATERPGDRTHYEPVSDTLLGHSAV